MKRLGATILCDIRLQSRNGFYYAAVFVAVFWIFLLRQLPQAWSVWLMPLFVLSNLQINTFYFVGGLVLLEKGEGTLAAQVVTPLRDWEYLLSKAATLTLLSLVENLGIAILALGLEFQIAPLILSIVAGAVIFVFSGFSLASRYDSVSEYLFPSFLYTLAFAPPFLGYAGIWTGALMYLHPLQAPLVLARAAFGPAPVWYWFYGVLYSAVWIVILLWWSLRAFETFVVAAEGTR